MKRFVLILVSLALLCGCRKTDLVISVGGQPEYNLNASASVLSLRVNTNSNSWDYDLGGADWLSEQKKDGMDLYLTVAANTTESARSTTVTFYVPGVSNAVASASVTVRQQGAVFDPEIIVEQSLEVPSEGGSFTVEVSTNQPSWEAEVLDDAASWLSAVASGASLKIDVAPNNLEDSRKGMVRVYAPGKANALTFKNIAIVQAPLVIEYDPVNLSENGRSNCYIITHKGEYSFDASVRGNGLSSTGLAAPSKLSPAGARLVWQTAKGMIKRLSFADGVISFEAARINGSAVIAATDASGNIIWSWHIWYPSAEVQGLRNQAGDEMMNLNLGALDNEPSSITSHGMLYQWGRKDPFPYSPSPSGGSIVTMPINVYDIDGNPVSIGHTDMYSLADNSLAFSIANPATCISNNHQYSTCRDWLVPAQSNNALWGNPSGDERSDGKYVKTGTKSFYDPCPLGWRVAPVRDYVFMTESGGYTWATGDTEAGLVFSDLGGPAEVALVDLDGDGVYTLKDYPDGWYIYLNKASKAMSYFPAATRYDGQYAMLMGSMVGLWGNYWTNAPNSSDGGSGGLAIALSFGIKDYFQNNSITISPVSNGSRADAYSVRCIKE